MNPKKMLKIDIIISTLILLWCTVNIIINL